MKKKQMVSLTGIIMGMLVIFYAGYIGFSFLPAEQEILPVPIINQSEKILIDWVYIQSNRISERVCKEIVQESMKTSKPLLILAIMEVESNFIPTARSSKNAMGLMQVMPGVWEKDLVAKGIIKGRRDLYNIESNIKAGDFVLGSCLTQSNGNVEKALELYLGGKNGAYLKRILSNLASIYLLVDVRLH